MAFANDHQHGIYFRYFSEKWESKNETRGEPGKKRDHNKKSWIDSFTEEGSFLSFFPLREEPNCYDLWNDLFSFSHFLSLPTF